MSALPRSSATRDNAPPPLWLSDIWRCMAQFRGGWGDRPRNHPACSLKFELCLIIIDIAPLFSLFAPPFLWAATRICRLPSTPFIAKDTRLVTCPQNGVNKVMLRQHPGAAEPNHRVRPARGSPFRLCDDQHQLSRLHVVCDELQLVSAAWQCRYRSDT